MAKKTSGQGWSLISSDAPQEMLAQDTQPPTKQRVGIVLEKRKKGKVVTLIRNLVLSDADLKDLARALKIACGTGGTARSGEIELQGDCREQARNWLVQHGYGFK